MIPPLLVVSGVTAASKYGAEARDAASKYGAEAHDAASKYGTEVFEGVKSRIEAPLELKRMTRSKNRWMALAIVSLGVSAALAAALVRNKKRARDESHGPVTASEQNGQGAVD